MEIYYSRMDRRGRVAIPNAVCGALGLKPGDTIRFVVAEGSVQVTDAALADGIAAGDLSEWASEADEVAYQDL